METASICSEHFCLDDLTKSLTGKRGLKPGVEPSICEWKDTLVGRNTPTDRSSREPLANLSSGPADEQIYLEQESGQDNPTSCSDDAESTSSAVRSTLMYSAVRTQAPAVQTKDTSCQTDDMDSTVDDAGTFTDDHNYSFNFMSNVNSASTTRLREYIEYQSEIKATRQNLVLLKHQLENYVNQQFSLDKIKADNKAIQFYTGFPNFGAFNEYILPKAKCLQYWQGQEHVTDSRQHQLRGGKPGPKPKMVIRDQLFMVLVRLKVGLFVKDIAERFNISTGQFSRIFTTWINFLHLVLGTLFPFPSQNKIRKHLPQSFQPYPSTRLIIDCTEVFIEQPSSMVAQSETWSNYKHHNTYKVLVGVTPNGCVSFVSELWGGRVSDKEITKKSGVLDKLDVGDNLMADQGFELNDIMPVGTSLNIPPFKGERAQLSAVEVEETRNIATVRIHVERAIGRIKNYHILDGTLPLSLSHVAHQIFFVCAYLTNFLPPLVPPADHQD